MLSMMLWISSCRNLASDRLLNQIAQEGGFFNAHSGGSTKMKLEGSAVHAGEKIPAQPGNQDCQRAQARLRRTQSGKHAGGGDSVSSSPRYL